MLKRRLPKLNIIEGKLDAAGKASNAELDAVINQSDFFCIALVLLLLDGQKL